MPFSKAWRNAIYPDFNDEGAYVDYKATKEILHRMKENIANPSTPDELYLALMQQKLVVYNWCVRKQKELLRVASALNDATQTLREDAGESSRSIMTSALAHYNVKNKNIGKGKGKGKDPSSALHNNSIHNNNSSSNNSFSSSMQKNFTPRDARILADSVMHELLRFIECRNLNTDTVEHMLARMYRYAVLGPTGDRWRNVYQTYDLYSISVDEIMYHLSRVYDNVRQTEERMSATSKARIPTGTEGSQVFDRKSIKYWVHMQDLPFVIARIIPHLPLSTFKDTYHQSLKLNKPFTLYSPVSSVYYDNNKFLFYHRRLERREGSTLIRMRWYSDNFAEDWSALQPDDSVFMEIKVHHEAWSGQRSTKRRFAVKEKDAAAYVHANLSLVPTLQKLRRKGAGVREQEDFKSLATEILTKIHCYDLKPVLRTQCGRAAFQRGIDQTVRVSIDTSLRLSAEDFGMSHNWRYTGNDAPVMDFPYAVVEIKLQFAENEKLPPWIEELMECRYMESIPKFSKYAHGIAALYGHTNFISMVPYWMHQLDVDIRASTKPEQSRWDPTVGLASGCAERLADQFIFGASAGQTTTVGASEARFLTRSDYQSNYRKMLDDLGSGGGANRVTGSDADNRASMVLDAPGMQSAANTAHDDATQNHSHANHEDVKDDNNNNNNDNNNSFAAQQHSSKMSNKTDDDGKVMGKDDNSTRDENEAKDNTDRISSLNNSAHTDSKSNREAMEYTATTQLPAIVALSATPPAVAVAGLRQQQQQMPQNSFAASSNMPPQGHQQHPIQQSESLSQLQQSSASKEAMAVFTSAPPLHSDRTFLPVVQYSVDRRHDAYTTFHLYPYTETGVESLCFHPKQHSRNASAEVFFGTIPWQTGKRIRVPQKYDPKTLLTSERYMAKWMQLATQIGIFGLVMVRFGNGLFLPQVSSRLARTALAHASAAAAGQRAGSNLPYSAPRRWWYASCSLLWRPQFHIVSGLVMVGVALAVLFYAYVAFKARARRVYARRKIRYDDVMGPTWMTFFIIIGFCLFASMHIIQRYSPMLTGDDSF